MTALNGIYTCIPFDSTYNLGPDRLFNMLPTICDVGYGKVVEKTSPGKSTINNIDLVNYGGMEPEEDEEGGESVNVAQKLDVLKGKGMKYNKRNLYSKKSVKKGAGVSQTGIPVHKEHSFAQSGPKHVMAHDPAHRLRSSWIHTKPQV